MESIFKVTLSLARPFVDLSNVKLMEPGMTIRCQISFYSGRNPDTFSDILRHRMAQKTMKQKKIR